MRTTTLYPTMLLLGIALGAGGWMLLPGKRSEAPQDPIHVPTTLPASAQPASGTHAPRPDAARPYLGAEPLPFLTNKKSDKPLHKVSKYPPRTRIPVLELPKVKNGIPCPDGSFLPFLNGMTWAPTVHRDLAYGPMPPVVAIQVDDAGIEWWEHADGSTTTCHYHEVTAFGKSYFDPVTRHGLPKPASEVRGADQPPAEAKGK
jgi:hypothetical protein